MIIGIDNGVTGSIAILGADGQAKWFSAIPIFRDLNYSKTKQFLNRLDVKRFAEILSLNVLGGDTIAILERPMVNPMRFKASMSALRCLEATLVVLELGKIPYHFIDSKEWQKKMLPAGLRKEELKDASDRVAKRLFPYLAEQIKNGNGDSLLIARYWFNKTK